MAPKKKRARRASNRGLPIVHPNAVGIDFGSRIHVAAVPADRDTQPVRTFETFT